MAIGRQEHGRREGLCDEFIVGSQDRAVCLVMNLTSTLGQRAASWERSLSVMFSGGSASEWQRCDVKVCQLRLPGTKEDRDPAHLSASWLWTDKEVSVPMHFPLKSSSEPEIRSEDFTPERREKGSLSKQEVTACGFVRSF